MRLWVGLFCLASVAACGGGGGGCPDEQGSCDEVCVDLTSSEAHCGACGSTCSAGEVCADGVCVSSCGEATPTRCGEACVDTDDDAAHCGGCDSPCAVGEVCAAGVCGLACGGATSTPCGGRCVDTTSDTAHCGGCDSPCMAGEVCADGVCELACGGTTPTRCGDACVDTNANRAHCGKCDQACAEGTVCTDGECRLTCGGATPDPCGDTCVDLDTHHLNCGACGVECLMPNRCADGVCALACGEEHPTVCGDRCENVATSREHCGADPVTCEGGQACEPGQACHEGACRLVCGGATPTPCGPSCVDTETNRAHCGGCDNACAAGAVCSDGDCRLSCGGSTPTLCGGGCVDTTTDVAHCGGCDQSCEPGEVCAGGICAVACFGDHPTLCEDRCVDTFTNRSFCGADPATCEGGSACAAGEACTDGACVLACGGATPTRCGDACVDQGTNASHCGGCDQACAAGEVCSGGTCGLACGGATPTRCGDACVDTDSDLEHCGGCDQACAAGEVCASGTCGLACGGDTATLCGDACVDTDTSAAHCGGCDQSCAAGEICSGGACGLACGGTTPVLCGAACVDTDTNVAHCGGCDLACDDGELCSGGTCGLACGGDTPTLCGAACVDTNTNDDHCGGCDAPCAAGEVCSGGSCGLACGGDTPILCGDACVDTDTNDAHCGACDAPCTAGEVCSGGACGLTCGGATPTLCGDACVDTDTNAAHCGGCDSACEAGEFCSGGACGLACGGDTPTLCGAACVDTDTNDAHCGGCDSPCAAGEVCSGGACGLSCGGATPTLCGDACVDTGTNGVHCGGCDQPCAAGEVCSGGMCGLSCGGATPTLCGSACVDTDTNDAHCGGCGSPCDPGEVCSGGACGLACGGDTPTLCGSACVDTDTNSAHCGGCDSPCAAGEFCSGGVCGLTCGGATPTLCGNACVDTDTDADHCGGCDSPCGGGEFCSGGVCGLTCGGDTPTLCGSACVDTDSDFDHCGGCDSPCDAGEACTRGVCGLACGGSTPTPCGDACVDTDTHHDHCGGCDSPCDDGERCSGGVCGLSCGGDTPTLCGNACVDTDTNDAHCGGCDSPCGNDEDCVAGVCEVTCFATTEICDGEDNDCDGETDEAGALDEPTWYADTDGDGYGDPAAAVTGCDQPEGYVDNDEDCDDGTRDVSPDQLEVMCDGVDNDCDGNTDGDYDVPEEYPTLQEAVDAAPLRATVCVAAGSYADPLRITDDVVTIVGVDAPVLDASLFWPLVTVSGSVADVTISGFALSGLDLSLSGETAAGGAVEVTDAAHLTLSEMSFSDIDIALDDASLSGGVLYASDATLTLQDVEVEGVTVTLGGDGDGSELHGGFLYGLHADVTTSRAAISDAVILSDEVPTDIAIWGGLVELLMGTLELDEISISSCSVDLTCSGRLEFYGLFRTTGATTRIRDLSLSENTAEVTSSDSVFFYGLVSSGDGASDFSDIDLTGNTVSAVGEYSYIHGAVWSLSGSDIAVSSARVWSNEFTARGPDGTGGGRVYGAVNYGGAGALAGLDIRANTGLADSSCHGGGLYLYTLYGTTLVNSVVAGNACGDDTCPEASGGGLYLAHLGADARFMNLDVVGNTAAGEAANGGGVTILNLPTVGADDAVQLVNVNIVGNTVSGTSTEDGSALYHDVSGADVAPVLSYCNVWEQADAAFSGMDEPTGSDGNISVDPLYADRTGDDSTSWDLTLQEGSPCIDAGSPFILDVDDSISDIGALGGPGGETGAGETCDGVPAWYYPDADADGFGAGDGTYACAQPADMVADDTDCDDDDPDVNPDATEVVGDGVDNDCDGNADGDYDVPEEYGTLQEAADAAPDGATIYVVAGSYGDTLTLVDRQLTFVAVPGGADSFDEPVILDAGTHWPLVAVSGASAEVTFTGFTLSGLRLNVSGADAEGGAVEITDAAQVTLAGMSFSDNRIDVEDASLLGGVLYASDASLSLQDAVVSGPTLHLDGSGGNRTLEGAFVYGDGASVSISDVAISGASFTSSDTIQYVTQAGALISLRSGDVALDRVSVTSSSVDLYADDRVFFHGLVRTFGATGTVSGLTLSDNTLGLTAYDSGNNFYGVFHVSQGELVVSALEVTGNSVAVDSDGVRIEGGAVYVYADVATIAGARIWNNTVTAISSSSSAEAHGLVNVSASGAVEGLDIRGNATSIAGACLGGGLYLYAPEDLAVRNCIIAGNTCGDGATSLVYGGGFYLAPGGSDVSVTNVDVVGNVGAGETVRGGGVHIAGAPAGETSLVNVNLVANVLSGSLEAEGTALYWRDIGYGATVALRYSNVHDQADSVFYGIEDLTGTDGNISADPLYADVAGADPTSWDLALQEGSPCIDAGDPANLDVDGSVSDIGAYGGPGGVDADGEACPEPPAYYFYDSDDDGYGDELGAIYACTQPAETHSTAEDCDGSDPDISPDATEVVGDGVDNDCDGNADGDYDVPEEYGTLQEAADAAPDGATIYVSAGSYGDTLTLADRQLAFVAVPGGADSFDEPVVLDAGTHWPFITVSGAAAEVTFTGFTFSGLDLSFTGANAPGGAIELSDAAHLTLAGMSFSDNAFAFSGAMLDGGIIYAQDSTLLLEDVQVDGPTVTWDDSGIASVLYGTFLNTSSVDVTLTRTQFSGASFTGVDMQAGVRLEGALIDIGGGSIAMDDVSVTSCSVDLAGTESFTLRGLVNVYNATGVTDGLTLADNTVSLSSTGASCSGYGLYASRYGQLDDANLVVTGNTFSALGTGATLHGGVIYRADGQMTISNARVWDNTVAATGATGNGWVQGLVHLDTKGDFGDLDIRGNTSTASSICDGGGVFLMSTGSVALTNSVIAGNTCGGDSCVEARGGGVYLEPDDADVNMENLDIVGNTLTAEYTFGGAIHFNDGGSRGETTLTNVSFVSNRISGSQDEAGSALYAFVDGGTDPVLSYCNVHGQADSIFRGIADPTGTDGNISVDPLYADVTGDDPTSWDLTLQAGSPCIDAGDPAILDVDGSVSDIGAYGGPGGQSAGGETCDVEPAWYYPDSDGDGYGDELGAIYACAQPADTLTDGGDCDDADPDVSPDDAEVMGDGIDNDCDGNVDGDYDVPEEYGTLQEAADAAPDGATIYVAPGSYGDTLTLVDRQLTFVAIPTDDADVVLDAGTNQPLISVSGATAHVTFSGFTLSGADLSFGLGFVDGGVIEITGGASLGLSAMRFTDNTFTLSSTSLSGGLIRASGASLTIEDTSVEGLTIDMDSSLISGGFLYASGSTIVLADVTFIGTTITDVGDGTATVRGGLISAIGGTVAFSDVAASGGAVGLTGSGRSYLYGLIELNGLSGTVDGLSISDGTVELSGTSERVEHSGLVFLDDVDIALADFVAEGNTVSLAGSVAFLYGLALYQVDGTVALDGARVWNNSATSEGSGAALSYAAVSFTGAGTADGLDVRGNTIGASGWVYGGGAYLEPSGPMVVRNSVFAQNYSRADSGAQSLGGGLHLALRGADLRIENVDVVGNVVQGGDAWGGGVYISSSDPDAELALVNANIVSNLFLGMPNALGSAVYFDDAGGAAPLFSYCNIHDHTNPALMGLADPTGSEGNISVDPDYTDVSGRDPTAWDLSLDTGSPCIDAGDPAIFDADDSVSDIGAYGGPGGVDADGEACPETPAYYYYDSDGDGYGDELGAIYACAQPADTDPTADDCDGSDPDVSPDAAEVMGDGVDNDCDGNADGDYDVPEEYASLQAAADAAPDGATIYVSAGSYGDTLTLVDRQLTFVGIPTDDAAVILDASSSWPLVTVSGAAAEVTFTGFTVTGLDLNLVQSNFNQDGGVFEVTGAGALTLSGLRFTGNAATLALSGFGGGLVYAYEASISVEDTTVEELTVTMTGGSSGASFSGAFLYASRSTVTLSGVTITGATIADAGGDDAADVWGGLIAAGGGTLDLQDVTVSDCSVMLFGSGLSRHYGLVQVIQASGSVDGLTMSGNVVAISATDSQGEHHGLVNFFDASLEVSDFVATNNSVGIVAEMAMDYGAALVQTEGSLSLSGARVWENYSRSNGTLNGVSWGVVSLEPTGTVEGLDIRRNFVRATGFVLGAGLFIDPRGTVELRNSVVAGNQSGDDQLGDAQTVNGAGVFLVANDQELTLTNVDIVGNEADVEFARGGALYIYDDPRTTQTRSIALVNVNMVSNTLIGVAAAEGTALYADDASIAVTLSYCNVFDQADTAFHNVTDPTGSDGNLSVDPLYTDVSSGYATDWDLTLGAGSLCIDAGFPFLYDVDGTISDIGAYGGPDGVDASGESCAQAPTFFFLDSDGDGYGDELGAVYACTQPADAFLAAEDCDGSDPDVSPDAPEVMGDNVDNDCDGNTDGDYDVPEEYATLQEATNAAPDGAIIAVVGGSYGEALDLAGRQLTIVGFPDPASDAAPVLDATTEWPLVSVSGAGATVSFAGFTVSGLDLSVGTAETATGVFAVTDSADLVLTGMTFTDNAIGISGGTLRGGLIHASAATLILRDATVDGWALTPSGSNQSSDCYGGFLYGDAADVTLSEVTFSGVRFVSSGEIGSVDAFGALIYLAGGTLDLAQVSISGGNVDWDVSAASSFYGLVATSGVDGTITDLSLSNNSVSYTATGDQARHYGLLYMEGGGIDLDGVDAMANRVTSSTSGRVYGGSIHSALSSAATFHDLDVRDTYVDTHASCTGAGFYLSLDGPLAITGSVIAGNTCDTSQDLRGNDAAGAGLWVLAKADDFTLTNVDIVGNGLAAGIYRSANGGGLYLMDENDGGANAFVNVNIFGNFIRSAGVRNGSAIRFESSGGGTTPTFAYCNQDDNASTSFSGLDYPEGSDGNIVVDPLYTDISGTDATTWDLTLGDGSPCIDAGDPTILDEDGSPSDIGAYGGS